VVFIMGSYHFSIKIGSIVLYHSRDGEIRGETKELFTTGTTKRSAVDWMERVYNWVGLFAFVRTALTILVDYVAIGFEAYFWVALPGVLATMEVGIFSTPLGCLYCIGTFLYI
jgi:hypothetical protein